MSRRFYIAGFTFGVVGIILGAFATHGLKPVLAPEAINSFEIGVQYQIYHSLLLLLLGNMQQSGEKISKWIFYLLISGILLFSGSIYLLATNSLTTLDFRFLGPVTPVGGSLLIISWILLLVHFLKKKSRA